MPSLMWRGYAGSSWRTKELHAQGGHQTTEYHFELLQWKTTLAKWAKLPHYLTLISKVPLNSLKSLLSWHISQYRCCLSRWELMCFQGFPLMFSSYFVVFSCLTFKLLCVLLNSSLTSLNLNIQTGGRRFCLSSPIFQRRPSPPHISLCTLKTSRSTLFTPVWTGLQTYQRSTLLTPSC